MKTSFVLTLATFVSAAFALPAANAWGGGGDGGSPTPYNACTSGLYSNPQCCATDVLGVADLTCASPPAVPTSAEDFQSICADRGAAAKCCVIPVLGQSVLCEVPVGISP